MPKKQQKSLQEYISKMKKKTPHLQFCHRAFASTTSKILAGCKHPKSLSFTGERKGHNDDVAATLEDIDKFLIENFKSLYGEGSSGKEEDDKTKVCHQRGTSEDIINLKGGTNVIETTSNSKASSEEQGSIEDCIALLTVSPSPYVDFRRSMQEMLDARINNDQSVNWDFLEELLFSYLKLNEKKQYKYILSAFVDLVVLLRQNSNN